MRHFALWALVLCLSHCATSKTRFPPKPQVPKACDRLKLEHAKALVTLHSAVAPQEQTYDMTLLIASNHSEVTQGRFQALLRHYEEGVRFRIVIVLVGNQSLILSAKAEYSSLEAPQKFWETPVVFVAGSSTKNALREWLRDFVPPARILAISSQPHVFYHHALLRSLIPASSQIDSIGEVLMPVDSKVALERLSQETHELSAYCPKL